MSLAFQRELAARLGKRALFDEPLAAHTTWRLGGPAWCLARVETREEAALVMAGCRLAGMGWMALGRGSNLLVLDGGYPGVVIRLWGPLAKLSREGSLIRGGGGAYLPAALKLAERSGLSGLEWAAGIPASLGGAVATNAGAAGGDMAGVVEKLEVLAEDGVVESLAGSEIQAGYRFSALPAGGLVTGVSLSLRPARSEDVARRRRDILERRKATQPLGQSTAGCVFKNPPGDSAGRIIDALGLKGLSVGDAMVSPVHANFIVNRGRATAREVLALVEKVSREVRSSLGLDLELEVKVVGHA